LINNHLNVSNISTASLLSETRPSLRLKYCHGYIITYFTIVFAQNIKYMMHIIPFIYIHLLQYFRRTVTIFPKGTTSTPDTIVVVMNVCETQFLLFNILWACAVKRFPILIQIGLNERNERKMKRKRLWPGTIKNTILHHISQWTTAYPS